MKTVLLTGANGFVAYYLVRLLADRYRVVATSKGPWRQPYDHPNVRYEALDFTREEEVKDTFDRHAPQVVLHAGALSKPDDCERDHDQALLTNTEATGYLLAHAVRHGSYFLFLSTDFIFDGRGRYYREDDEPGPVNFYGQTKLLAESAVKAYPHGWCIVRTVLVYGPNMDGRHNLVTLLAEKLRNGEPYNVFDDQVRTPTYVEDLAIAICALLQKEERGVFHISGEDVITPYGIGLAIAKHLQLDPGLLKPVTAATFPQPAARPAKTGFDLSRAKAVIDFKPTGFADGLARTFEGNR
jgi:dTDP-4-dehydrorhamnose reductase